MFFNRRFPYHGRQFTNPYMVEKCLGEKGENAIILGKNMKISLDSNRTNLNNRFLMIGEDALLIENIKHWKQNILCYDTNGYYNKYKNVLEKNGHIVLKFDPEDQEHSICINPFDLIQGKPDIVKLSEILLSYAGDDEINKESEWEQFSELPYLNSMLYYIWTEYGKNYHNLATLFDLLKKANYIEHGEWFYIDTIINKRKIERGEKDPAVKYYTTFLNAAMNDVEVLYYFRKKVEKRLSNISKIEQLLFSTTKLPDKNLVLFFKPGYDFLFHILHWHLKNIIIIGNEKVIPNPSLLHKLNLYFEQQETYICSVKKIDERIKKQISFFNVILKSGKIENETADYLLENHMGTKKKLLADNNIVKIKNFGTLLLQKNPTQF